MVVTKEQTDRQFNYKQSRKWGSSMKLIKDILSKENLNKGYLQVFKNKGSTGIDVVSVNELNSIYKYRAIKLTAG